MEMVCSCGAKNEGRSVCVWGRCSRSSTDGDRTLCADLLDNVVRLDGSFVGGFQMATSKGPLCEEPMSGVCAIVTAVSFETGYNPFSPDGWIFLDANVFHCPSTVVGVSGGGGDVHARRICTGVDAYGPLSGQLISATKEACRQAFVVASSRLVQAMYKCLVHVPSFVISFHRP